MDGVTFSSSSNQRNVNLSKDNFAQAATLIFNNIILTNDFAQKFVCT
jgi:hypothetical protein